MLKTELTHLYSAASYNLLKTPPSFFIQSHPMDKRIILDAETSYFPLPFYLLLLSAM